MTRKNAIVILIITIMSAVLAGISIGYFKRKRKLKEIGQYQNLISEISEVIIPQTDTPGAKEAGVVVYVINVIETCLSDRDRRIVLVGLDDIEEYSRKRYSRTFAKCSEQNKAAVLAHFQNKGNFDNAFLNKVKNKLLGPSFFELIKSLVVKGYCISELGATEGLAYEHIPVHYISCTTLLPNQQSWATA